MSSNDITGHRLISKPANDKFRSEYDRLFGKPKDKKPAKKSEDK